MNKYMPIENLSVQKSNSLVSAKYKSSLVENQIMSIALTRIEVNAADKEAPIQAKLWPGELKRLIGDPSNIYKTLKKVSKTMTGHTMFLEDGKGNFKAFAVVNNADYIDGVFTVEFNKNLRNHILGLEKNYTSFELAILTRFKKNSSFRIYELLKSHIYKSRKEVNNGRVDVEYNISELRFMIGLANGDDPSVKNAIAGMGNNIDWDLLYSKLDKKDRKYETWFDFQRYVVKPAQEELQEKSNICFEYEGVREGRKMGRIRFYVYPNKPENQEIVDERAEFIENNAKKNRQMELPRDLDIYKPLYDEFVGHNNLTDKDLDVLLKISKFDDNRVKNAIKMADEASENSFINNYMGWIVKCIEEKWDVQPVSRGSAERGEEIVRVQDEYNKADKEELAERFLKKIKTKADYQQFVDELENIGVNMEVLESVYTKDEIVQGYSDWKRGKGLGFLSE